METKNTEYCLVSPVDSVEEFLKTEFKCSSNRLKKYFQKSFLNKSLREKSTISLPLNFTNDGQINPVYEGNSIDVIDESDLFFVFTKNPNQYIHPLTYDESDNCLSFIRQTKPELLQVNKSHYDRGLLYRLDYETSGVVIYVKDNDLYKKLRDQFSEVAKEKIYRCWVEGRLTDQGSFQHTFSSSEAKGKRVIVGPIGKYDLVGELEMRPVEYNEQINRTLVEVKLKTGLRHQIRAQMAHLGFPLAGDLLYGGKPAKRLYLHALSYQLMIEGKKYSWISNPIDFNGL